MLPPFRFPAAVVLTLFATITSALRAQQPAPREACRQAVFARFSPAPIDLTVEQVSPTSVEWHIPRGASGTCVIDSGGRVVRVETQG